MSTTTTTKSNNCNNNNNNNNSNENKNINNKGDEDKFNKKKNKKRGNARTYETNKQRKNIKKIEDIGGVEGREKTFPSKHNFPSVSFITLLSLLNEQGKAVWGRVVFRLHMPRLMKGK